MGIFKKIFDWTNHGAAADISRNRQTVSRQRVEQNSPLRKVTETSPAPVVSEPDLTALDSSVSEFVPYPVVNSYQFEEPIRKQEQDPFASSPEWKKERS